MVSAPKSSFALKTSTFREDMLTFSFTSPAKTNANPFEGG